MTLRSLHRTSAIVIAAFALLHVANHLASLVSIPSHLAFMTLARTLYRLPFVEFPLLFCVAFQVGSGLWLVIRGWRQRQGGVAWLQAISGAVLAFFLVVHVGAVLYGRAVLHLDTNFYFAAAGFHVPPNQYFFGPYYFLAVLSLFTHLGCAAYWHHQTSSAMVRRAALALPVVLGSAVSALIVLSLAGKLQPLDVPAKYKATYAGQGSRPLTKER
jgi:succinate dehydrogenase/fumarate reductase cytochrome b subunit